MLFNSIEYLIFFPTVVVAYFLMPFRWRWVLLLLASYFFYMSWNPGYLILIVGSTVVDYWAGMALAHHSQPAKRKMILSCSLFINLGLLFTFKYFNFFDGALVDALGYFGLDYQGSRLNVILPAGISFYTLQTLSYTIDVYYGKIPPEKHLGRFALYVAFFPQLVAGPIERASRLLPQFLKEHRFNEGQVIDGLKLILWGMFKKIVIADRLTLFVDFIYAQPQHFESIYLVIAAIFFTFQVYCDFSGYSDIAIGSAQVMGINLMDNFDRPFFTRSILEFWRRWHISLSSWLRDYLYIPMGGSRAGKGRYYFNLFFVFAVCGLWHGAAWTFVVFGAMHGTYAVLSVVTRSIRARFTQAIGLTKFPRVHLVIQVMITFGLFCFSLIVFRAQSIQGAWYIIWHVITHPMELFQFDFHRLGQPRRELFIAIGAIFFMELVHFTQPHASIRHMFVDRPRWLRWVIYLALTLAVINLGVYEDAPFIYFQF